MNLLKIVLVLPFVFMLFGCTTYYISPESFKEQFKDINSTKLVMVQTVGPAGDVVRYPANPLRFIKCVDDKNQPVQLANSPSLEIRFTLNDDSRTVFYFDQLYLQDSLIIGNPSRFLPSVEAIPLHQVKLIEIQDGHKDFKYLDR